MNARAKLPVELPDNVVLLRPSAEPAEAVEPRRKRPKRAGSGLAKAPRNALQPTGNLQGDRTSRSSENANGNRVLRETGSVTRGRENQRLSVPSANAATPARTATRARFEKQVQSFTAMELRERFPKEASCHKQMMGRCSESGRARDLQKGREPYSVHRDLKDFRAFLLHLGPMKAPGHSIDRKDPTDHEYAPGKIRWASPVEQANNRSTTIFLTIGDEIRSLSEWARLTGQKYDTLLRRHKKGLTPAEVVHGRNMRPPEATEQPAYIAPETEGYVWPGSKAHLWEAAFRSFRAFSKTHPFLRECPRSAFTRDVFLAWLGTNIVNRVGRELARKHPGYGEPNGDPDHQDPPEARADPLYRFIEVFDRPAAQACSRVREARGSAAHSLLEGILLRKFSRVTTFAQPWSDVFAHLRPMEE